MARTTVAQEITLEPDSEGPAILLELDLSPRCVPTFVTGAAARSAPEIAECPYCGTPGRGLPLCARCGAPTRATPPALPRATRYISPVPLLPAGELSPLSPPSRGEVFVDAITTIPFGIWKRLPVYAFLAMVLGNGFRCGGLSARVNAMLVMLIVIGVVGAVLSSQRSP